MTPTPELDPDALAAARTWAAEHGHQQPDDRMLAAYGRVIAARADLACAHCNHPWSWHDSTRHGATGCGCGCGRCRRDGHCATKRVLVGACKQCRGGA